MENEYRSLPDYPDVEANCYGDVRWKSGKSIKVCYGSMYNAYYVRLYYSLHDTQQKDKVVSMFNLIGKLFVESPHHYKFIRATNGDNSDYRASNLEWVKSRRKKVETEEDC